MFYNVYWFRKGKGLFQQYSFRRAFELPTIWSLFVWSSLAKINRPLVVMADWTLAIVQSRIFTGRSLKNLSKVGQFISDYVGYRLNGALWCLSGCDWCSVPLAVRFWLENALEPWLFECCLVRLSLIFVGLTAVSSCQILLWVVVFQVSICLNTLKHKKLVFSSLSIQSPKYHQRLQ